MKRLVIMAAMAGGLMLTAGAAMAAYCTNIQAQCPAGTHQQVCCNDPTAGGPPPALPDPNNPPSSLTLCGAIDDLIGGCVQLPPGTIAGCVDGAGLDLASPPAIDPNNPPAFPPNNCGNLAATACAACGCASQSATCLPGAP